MGREKSPGLKILWIWTLGTAAILVTSVVRTRLGDMEQMMNDQRQQEQQQQQGGLADSAADQTAIESEEGFVKEFK